MENSSRINKKSFSTMTCDSLNISRGRDNACAYAKYIFRRTRLISLNDKYLVLKPIILIFTAYLLACVMNINLFIN